MRRNFVFLLAFGPYSAVAAQSAKPAVTAAPRIPAGMSAIREADLKRDLYTLASDAMRGREAGTVDELRASMWLAEEMRKIGLSPSGEDGSWFQWWNMRRTRISNTTSAVKIGDFKCGR
jgi:hypothetical protein